MRGSPSERASVDPSRDRSTSPQSVVVARPRQCRTIEKIHVEPLAKGSRFKEFDMRVMVMVRADKKSEAGVMPGNELLAAMGTFNEELANAGILLAGEGLHPSSKGARVRFSGDSRTVIDGPFAETKELIAGYWLWQVKSLQEAIEWVKRCPNPLEGVSEIEIRPLFEADDFGAEFTPELRQQEERIRAQAAERAARQR